MLVNSGWFYLLGGGGGLAVLGCWGLLFAASSRDALPALAPKKIWLLFSLLPPHQILEELVVALHDTVLSSSSGTGSLC